MFKLKKAAIPVPEDRLTGLSGSKGRAGRGTRGDHEPRLGHSGSLGQGGASGDHRVGCGWKPPRGTRWQGGAASSSVVLWLTACDILLTLCAAGQAGQGCLDITLTGR
jgi:hypothetical protein